MPRSELKTIPNQARRHDVTGTHDERVDHLFGLVFRVPRSDQPQRLPHGIRQRVVEARLGDARGFEDHEHRRDEDGAVASQRRCWHEDELPANPDILDHPRDDEQLQCDAGEVDPFEIAGLELRDVGGCADAERPCFLRRRIEKNSVEDVVARLGAEVQDEYQGSKEEQVAVTQDQAEAAALLQRVVTFLVLRSHGLRRLAPVHDESETEAGEQDGGGNQHESKRADAKQARSDAGARNGAD
ncbi:MAG: hypothetical protein WDO69_14805 [Pseudomonadota bacterium]